MSNFLIKLFIKNNENVEDLEVRSKYGYLAGVVGIASNLILFIVKLLIGLICNSVAVMADAFNNLSDMTSSIITILGFKFASMPADSEHPFGHARLENIASLIVSFMVMFVGLKFVGSSIDKIINPEPVIFKIEALIIILLSIGVKLWLSRFNKYIGIKIDSKTLKAVAADSLGDVYVSTCVMLSLIANKFTSIPIDGIAGILVALGIIYAGIELVKETISPLLGEAPDIEMVNSIKAEVLRYDMIIGVHDLIVHNYGVGKHMATIHAEVPSNLDIMEIHDVIDLIEREVSKKLNIHLVIHMDPVCVDDEEVMKSKEVVENIVFNIPYIKSMHDFRVVGKGEKKNLVFDVVVGNDIKIADDDIVKEIVEKVRSKESGYNCVIDVDRDYHY